MKKLNRLRLADWPEADREAWDAALTATDDPWEDNGAALRLRPATRRGYERVWGIYLAWLDSIGELRVEDLPGQRVTKQLIQAWIRHLRELKRANGTKRLYLMSLHCILQFIAPGTDTKFIRRPGGRSIYEVFPTKGKPFVSHDTDDLLSLVNDLHAEGMAAPLGLRRWKLLRDAAIMATLYSRAPRISDLAAMCLGEHLITRHDGSFLIRFPKEITKNHRTLEYSLDPEPTAILRDYLVHARPNLAGMSNADQVWMGTTGRPLGFRGLEGLIKRRNLDIVGRAEGPHMARKWLADTARKRSPEAAFHAAEVAGHSPEVAVEHYHQSKDLHAGGRHGKRISRLRRRTAGLAERAFEDLESGRKKRNVE